MAADIEAEQQILAEARTEVSYADTKSSILFAALGVGFGAFLGGAIASDWTPDDLGSIAEVLWWLGAAALFVATILAGLAIWPRLGNAGRSGPIHYWGDVAACRTEDEMRTRLDENPTSLEDRTRNQMWALSKIVTRKHELVRASMVATALSGCIFTAVGFTLL